jgi:hypothetical protein
MSHKVDKTFKVAPKAEKKAVMEDLPFGGGEGG